MRLATRLTYNGIAPQIGDGLASGVRVTLIGRLVLGQNALLGDRALIRGDGDDIRIGDDFTLGAGGTVHIAHETQATHVGDRVSAGAGAVIHACTVGNDCAIGAGVIILDGSVIGAGTILEDGTLVFPGTQLAGGFRYAGQPAVPVGPVTAEDVAQARAQISTSVRAALGQDGGHGAETPAYPHNFVASTAAVMGDVHLGQDASIFFSCDVLALTHRVTVGARSNVQDNSIVLAKDGDVTIGAGTTIGHNVSLHDCTIGDDCLIGMGAHLASGTIVDSGTVVAAGTHTAPGAHLTGGMLWGGSPVRVLSALKPRHQSMVANTVVNYVDYANQFRKTDVPPA